MSRLQAACNAATERKAAVAGFASAEDAGGTFLIEGDTASRLFLGWELNTHELSEVAMSVGQNIVITQVRETPIPSMVSGAWLDGMLTGLMLADPAIGADEED